MIRLKTTIWILFSALAVNGQNTSNRQQLYKPYVNQAGYNIGESKRFVCYGTNNGTTFEIINTRTGEVGYKGVILDFQGWFTEFDPVTEGDEYVVEVKGRGRSVPFRIADHLMETVSTKLAYDFFVDVRGFDDLSLYDPAQVYSGGPSRDSGAFGLETIFEILLYASNPALFDRWTDEMGSEEMPDLIALILWHGEFAYKYRDYNGPVKNRHGTLGYEGEERMLYDYWNTVDQLAAICAAYHSFLKPYLPEEVYQKYRQFCLEKWEEYDRHKEVRYWTYSSKWVDKGFQEFNEMGNAFGQGLIRNLLMYVCEKNEKDGDLEKFLKWAQECATDIIDNWDFNNPRHMWWIRNAEHITPQALALFMLIAPDEVPQGTERKLKSWAVHMKQHTNNFWKYRKHDENEWAHSRTKELGGAPALAGSMFAVAHLLDDPTLRQIGWAQVDFTFGVNPVGAHLSNKSQERVERNGYWEGVEIGWPQSHPNGFGKLGLVRGTLDGSPLDEHFPIINAIEATVGENNNEVFGKNAYATEGWSLSNRGWMATVAFSTLGSHQLTVFDNEYRQQINEVKPGQVVTIELKAALNQDPRSIEKGWVEINNGMDDPVRLEVTETAANSGVFIAKYTVPRKSKHSIRVSYGYLGLSKTARLQIR